MPFFMCVEVLKRASLDLARYGKEVGVLIELLVDKLCVIRCWLIAIRIGSGTQYS